MFNLAAPPHFRGLDPLKPLTVYQRHLPHWRQDGATYFVTFRLRDALPRKKREYLDRLRTELQQRPSPPTKEAWDNLARRLFLEEESWLDKGYGACHFRSEDLALLLRRALLHFQCERYFTSCFVIMPNHCHAVIQPFDDHSLEVILQGIKGVVARQVNERLHRTGSLWQEESYDRIVRDAEHLWRVIQYIGRNPARAGIPPREWNRWIHPDWEALGWRFIDDA